MANNIGFLFADANLTVVLRGEPYDISSTHLHYKEIVSLLSAPEGETPEEAEERCDLLTKLAIECDKAAIIRDATFEVDDISVSGGVVYVKGEPVHSSLAERIIELSLLGLPYDSFLKFMANLSKNPSEESRQALFAFLEQGKFPLTDDGCFLGYKGVIKGTLKGPDGEPYDTLVDRHSKSFDMAPGNTHSMPWDAVDDNRGNACGQGFHVGTVDHARGFGSKMVIVKVNPKDCVSVPTSDTTKLRCCEYSVVGMFEDYQKAKEFAKPVYSEEDFQHDGWEEEDQSYAEEQEAQREDEEGSSREEELTSLNRDDLCRRASAEGYFFSTNEARWAGKDFVLSTLLQGRFPLADKGEAWIRRFASKRRLSLTDTATLPDVVRALEQSLQQSLRQV